MNSNQTEYLDAIFNSNSNIDHSTKLNSIQIETLKSMSSNLETRIIDIYLLNQCFKRFYNKSSTKQSVN